MLHENASHLHLAIRRLSMVEQRLVKLRMAGRSLREIAATFGHAPTWAQTHWESAAHQIRRQLFRRRPAPPSATKCELVAAAR